MIVRTDHPQKPGTTVRDMSLSDSQGIYHSIPVYILREATEKEWVEWSSANGGEGVPYPGVSLYYEVSID